MKIGPKYILDYFNQDELDISYVDEAISINANLFSEIVDLEIIEQGCSTLVFRKNENKVLCLSVDYNKVLYLKKSKFIKDFKFIRFAPFQFEKTTFLIMIYEMEFLEKLDIETYKELSSLHFKLNDKAKELIDRFNLLIDFERIDIIQNNKYTSGVHFDLHEDQFGINKFGEIICFDPIISDNIF